MVRSDGNLTRNFAHSMTNDLNAGPIIITGGAQRAGLAIARSLAKRGQSVVITYRSHRPGVDELSELGVLCLPCDFAKPRSIDDLLNQLQKRFRSIRGLIHNASDWVSEDEGGDFHELFQQMMRIHAEVPYRLNLALAPQLQAFAKGEGPVADIIHFTDYIVAKGSARHIAYAASKAALDNLNASFAQRLAPSVKVNAIAPSLLAFNEHDSEAYRKKAIKKSLLERVPGFDEAVRAVEFLLASGYITGQTLHLDGGRHLR